MTLIKEPDYGTPAADSEQIVELQIDGQPVKVPAGTSVMRAAALAGFSIPKLCATDSLEAFGSCRLCLVEIEGGRGTPASCTTPVAAGMKVKTQTPKLEKLRRGVMELYISDHPLDCLTCPANGDCELQDMAGVVGLREVRYGFDGENHLDAPTDSSNPYFDFDESKCIACSRCVRACSEVQGTFALTIAGRGFDSKVSASAGELFFSIPSVFPAVPASRPARPRRCRKNRSSTSVCRLVRSSPLARTVASAVPSRPKCAATSWCAWCRTRTAGRTKAIPA